MFCKLSPSNAALINCTMPDTAAWVRAKAPPRPNLCYLTYRMKDTQGGPARSADGSAGPATFTHGVRVASQGAQPLYQNDTKVGDMRLDLTVLLPAAESLAPHTQNAG